MEKQSCGLWTTQLEMIVHCLILTVIVLGLGGYEELQLLAGGHLLLAVALGAGTVVCVGGLVLYTIRLWKEHLQHP